MRIELPCDGRALDLCRRRLANFETPPRLGTGEWATRYRRFHRKDGARPGPWVSEPHQAEIMDAWDDPKVRRVVLMGCSQFTGKSAMMANILGRSIHIEPVNMMVVHPTIKAADRWAKGRLEPLAEATPVLRERLPPRKARNGDQTILHRQFAGGQMFINGANAPTDLAAQTVRWVLFDEVDRFEASAGSEGDPVDLAVQRTVDYGQFAKVWMSSTPTIFGSSRIEMAYEKSDKRVREACCRYCGGFFEVRWEHVIFTDPETGVKRPETAHVRCGLCARDWTEADRLAAGRRARWRPTAGFNGTAGFRLNAFICPRASLPDLAQRFVDSLGTPEQEQTFANTIEARTWRPKADAPPWEHLYARRETWPHDVLPAGVLLLCGAADIQRDRIEVRLWGFGRNGGEAWHLDTRVFLGNTARDEVWRNLDALLEEHWQAPSGAEVQLDRLAVDSGYATEECYRWAKPHRNGRRVMLVKGAHGQAVVLGTPTSTDVSTVGKRAKYGVRVWPVGGARAKEWFYQKMALPVPGDGKEYPPGFVHLSTLCDEDEIKQLTSEELRTGRDRYGKPRLEWHLKPGHRNEALDCLVYSYAAAIEAGLWRNTDRAWAKLEASLGLARAEPSEPAPTASPAPGPALGEAEMRTKIFGGRVITSGNPYLD